MIIPLAPPSYGPISGGCCLCSAECVCTLIIHKGLSATDLCSVGLLACYFSPLCHPSTSIHPSNHVYAQKNKFKCCFHKAPLLGHQLRTRGPLSGMVRGGAVLAFSLAFDRGLIKGCETLATEWGLMGDMHA